jgi:CDP-6-deoxy-D-xylo-4-hexulose-3-dehydrase
LLQPAYYNLDLGDPNNYPVANNVVENTFWLGVYPGLTKEMLDFVIEKTKQFLESNTN